MRVFYFHQHFTTPQGAGGIRSYQMARALIKKGHSVTMICGSYLNCSSGLTAPFSKGVRRGQVDGIDVVEFELPTSNKDGFVRRTWTFSRFALRSAILALREPCDVVVATSTPLTIGIPGVLARHLRRRRFVFEVRDLWPELPKAMGVISNPLVLAAMGGLEWVSYRSATRLIALSPGIQTGIARIVRDPATIDLIPNGCDTHLMEGDDVTPWRPDSVAPTDLMAVFAGAHGPANGLGSVLDAAAVLMARQRSDIKIVLIGDGKLKVDLQERVRNETLSNVVMLDPVPKLEIAGLLRAADLGLQILADVPAFYEGTSPNKFFDYLACGLPVVNNYPGWLARLIDESGCGFVVPPGDSDAFADSLEAAADNRDQLRVMGEAAKRLGRDEFDRQRLAEAFVRAVELAEKT